MERAKGAFHPDICMHFTTVELLPMYVYICAFGTGNEGEA